MASNSESTEFLEHVNSTARKLGHNKLQMEIDTLNKEIEAWKVADAQKEVKLDLFKKTIANLQSQLQEKASRLNELQSSLDNNPAAQIHQLTQLITDKDSKIEQLSASLEIVRRELDLCSSQLQDADKVQQSQRTMIDSKCSEIESLKTTIEQQVRSIAELEADNLTLRQDLQMKTNLVDNSQTELEILRQELAVYKTKMEEQVLLMMETESELQKQLEFAQPPETTEDTTPRVVGVTKKKPARGEPKKRR